MEGKGGGERHPARRLHIIYFLSRRGRFEQPHLIRVHHLSRNGVYLRDVKRWLADLRGKDMPEAFSWSYKRRYKTGYVWQDLLDDDLITPTSDNEYVLKGSLVSFDPLSNSLGEKKTTPESNDLDQVKDERKSISLKGPLQNHPDSKTQTPSEIHEESPEPLDSARSTITDEYDSINNKKFDNHSSLYANLLNIKSKKNNNVKDSSKEKSGTPSSSFSSSSTSSSSSASPFTKSKTYSSGASNMFRNLITCGAVDTNDSVLVITNRPGKNAPNKSDLNKPAQICKGDKFGGSERIFRSIWNHNQIDNPRQQQNFSTARRSVDGGSCSSRKNKQNEFSNLKTVSGGYKPVRWPKCSQCGKSFEPEKMHAHMKTCRGMKALPKTAASCLENTASHRLFIE